MLAFYSNSHFEQMLIVVARHSGRDAGVLAKMRIAGGSGPYT